jgi:hypothetical protein
MLRRTVSQKNTDVSEALVGSIVSLMILMTQAIRTAETSVNLYQTTRRNIPEDILTLAA